MCLEKIYFMEINILGKGSFFLFICIVFLISFIVMSRNLLHTTKTPPRTYFFNKGSIDTCRNCTVKAANTDHKWKQSVLHAFKPPNRLNYFNFLEISPICSLLDYWEYLVLLFIFFLSFQNSIDWFSKAQLLSFFCKNRSLINPAGHELTSSSYGTLWLVPLSEMYCFL